MDDIIWILVLLLIGVIGLAICANLTERTETKIIKSKMEIVERLKEGNFTREELDYILSGDEKLKKLINNFYEIRKTKRLRIT